MGLFNKRKRREKQKRIENEVAVATENFISSTLNKNNRIGRILLNIQKWCNSHKRGFFYIIISFFSLICAFTMYKSYKATVVSPDVMVVTSKIAQKFQDKKIRKTQKFSKLIDLWEKKNTIETIMEKDSLTSEDSLTINRMYNQIINDEKNN